MTPLEDGFRVLIVEDDADTRENLRDILEIDNCQVDTAATFAEAVGRKSWTDISAIVLDRKLPDGNALELLPILKQRAPHASVIVVTGYADVDGAISAIRQGAEDYILKPINADAFRNSLSRIAQRQRATREIERLNTHLQQHVTELQTLLDVIPIGIAIARDAQCKVITANPPLSRILGAPSGSNVSMSADPAARPKVKVYCEGEELTPDELPMQRAARQNIEVRDAELEIVHEDGQVFYLVGNCAPLLDEQGKSRGSVGAFLDITERKQSQERQLQQERLAAIGETMAGLVHESRNALQRSRACLEMLALEVEDRPEALKLVSRIQLAQQDLHQLYEEVREYAAPIKLKREPCDLAQVWRDTWANLAHTHESRNLQLRDEIDLKDRTCEVDRFAISQVLRNILENAIVVSPSGGSITIRCCESKLGSKPAIEVSIRDQGPGLNQEQHRRIFEPFYTTKTKGTGLGMAIAQRIVQSHGGRISVGPIDQPGAEFLIVLPRVRA